jgi:hypothetical protein
VVEVLGLTNHGRGRSELMQGAQHRLAESPNAEVLSVWFQYSRATRRDKASLLLEEQIFQWWIRNTETAKGSKNGSTSPSRFPLGSCTASTESLPSLHVVLFDVQYTHVI